ncbi:MAG TPA: tRNA (cytidine(34)-2'-O)-methyltransferase [Burkholderiales bacterium]|nr:tRNA (cytidine(34)-2'-O)-methyltransferase [Burkholderiales bacterium]
MFHIVLFEPEIPPNTGNALRLASNTGARLHLVRPLGFTLRDRQLLRAGLDYTDLSCLAVHDDWGACLTQLGSHRLFAVTTRGLQRYDAPQYRANDVFVFGPETRGLPDVVIDAVPEERRIRVPMRTANRSLNLSNTVAVVVYEAWRQLGYDGAS